MHAQAKRRLWHIELWVAVALCATIVCCSTAGRRLRHFGVRGGNHVFAIFAPSTQMTFSANGKNFRAPGRLQRQSKKVPKWSWGIAERFTSRNSKSSGQQRRLRKSVKIARTSQRWHIKNCLLKSRGGGPPNYSPHTSNPSKIRQLRTRWNM